nr:Cas9 endonuclease PAM-interacting domain-containing protein [Bombilactobacillus bombi]
MRVETDKRKKELAANSSFLLHNIEDNQALADENGEIIWPADQIQTIRQVLSYKQVNVTRKTEFNHGPFYNETLYAPGAKNDLIAQKQDRNPVIYGEYTGTQSSYSVLVKIDDKKIRLVGIPVYVDKLIQEQKVNLDDWLHDNVKHKKSLQVILTKVPKYQVVWSKEVGRLCLSSATEIQNFQQLVLSSKSYEFLTRTDQKNAVAEAIIKDMDYSFIDVYQEILDLMNKYYPFYKNDYYKLKNNFLIFKNCSINKQLLIIDQLLITLHANGSNGNLKKLEYGNINSERFGRKNKKNYDWSDTYFIYASPTGLFEKRVLIK